MRQFVSVSHCAIEVCVWELRASFTRGTLLQSFSSSSFPSLPYLRSGLLALDWTWLLLTATFRVRLLCLYWSTKWRRKVELGSPIIMMQ